MIKYFIAGLIRGLGYDLVRRPDRSPYPHDLEKEFTELHERCKNFTMTSIERMHALYKATEYIVNAEIPGDVVECGVWKGGSAMLAALILLRMGATDRKIYLYDTYEGMSEPTEKDTSRIDAPAKQTWSKHQTATHNRWCYSPLEEVEKNLRSTGYPLDRLVFVKGKVEETIPATVPERIALLRLDTDWYESTSHELRHLFPRLSSGGVLILDDYGYWEGAKEATDAYFRENKIAMMLNRIDNAGRIGVKLP